jgi:beta-lactamase class D
MKTILSFPTIATLLATSLSAQAPDLQETIRDTMEARGGTCVFVDCASGDILRSNPVSASVRLTPCSTFKIWNTLIGVECGAISSPDQPFYTWDGEERSIAEWNKDQTLKEAFRVSCVPAFQELARKIGPVNMEKWLDTIAYGSRDISSGIDDFWLPRAGKKSIQISPEEQALLLRKLLTGSLPFSEKAIGLLKQVMLVKETKNGKFYGKTGSGTVSDAKEKQDIGWFVGFIESSDQTYTFACVLKGRGMMGKNAREVVEGILVKHGML